MLAVLANILQPLIDFFEEVLKGFHNTGALSWGWSIIALTVVIRALLLPLTYKSSKGMIRLQQLAPEMKSLQTKYKQDPQRLQQETMKFYKQNQVNPFASCLPMIAQLPVFLALFYMLQADLRRDICPQINPVGASNPKPCGQTPESSFFFIPDLTDNATGAVLIALIVLYVGSQLVSTLLMSATTDRNQRLIFLALPFVFIIFIINFPAGLLVYWITTNLWTILQQAIIKKRLGPMRAEAMAAVNAAKEKEKAEGNGKESGALGPLAALRASAKQAKQQAEPAAAVAAPKRRSNGPPPSPPRKKKKRSGRRR